MNDWLRSVTVLGLGFGVVVLVTLELAILILPSPPGPAQARDGRPPAVPVIVEAPEVEDGVPTRLGGTLMVSGDREGTFTLDRQSTDGRYGLIGDDGRIFFANDPLAVEQMNFDGLSFFPEPDECTITPGELNEAIGVAGADLECIDVADVRGNGVLTIAGRIGLPADLLGMRGDLPTTGGTVDIGGETLVFTDAVLDIGPRPAIVGASPYRMQLVDEDNGTVLSFAYDLQTHRLVLANVERDGMDQDVIADACSIATRELGRLNPRVAIIEMSLQCAEVEVPGLGPVAIAGSVIVEQIEPPA